MFGLISSHSANASWNECSLDGALFNIRNNCHPHIDIDSLTAPFEAISLTYYLSVIIQNTSISLNQLQVMRKNGRINRSYIEYGCLIDSVFIEPPSCSLVPVAVTKAWCCEQLWKLSGIFFKFSFFAAEFNKFDFEFSGYGRAHILRAFDVKMLLNMPEVVIFTMGIGMLWH